MLSRSRNPILIPALLAALALPSLAAAQGSRIGLVDTRRLITQSASGKAVLVNLDKLADEKAGRMKPLQEEIQGLQKRIADGRVSLAEARLAEMQKELDDKITSARRLREDLEREMQEAQATEFAALERRLAPLVEQFGRENGFAFILNVGFFTQENQPSGIVWADEKVDVTNELILRLDAASPAP